MSHRDVFRVIDNDIDNTD